MFRLLLYQTIVVGAILYYVIKRVFYVPYEEASRHQRRKFAFTSKQPKSKKSKTPRPTPAPRSSPVTESPQSSSRFTPRDSSSSSDTVVETPYRTQPLASARRVIPQAPPPTSLERFETDLNRAAAQNVRNTVPSLTPPHTTVQTINLAKTSSPSSQPPSTASQPACKPPSASAQEPPVP